MEKIVPASQLSARDLEQKYEMAAATLERARKSLEASELDVETKRYLDQLFTSMVISEGQASW